MYKYSLQHCYLLSNLHKHLFVTKRTLKKASFAESFNNIQTKNNLPNEVCSSFKPVDQHYSQKDQNVLDKWYKEEKLKFIKAREFILQDVKNNFKLRHPNAETLKYFDKMLNHNVPSFYIHIGTIVVTVYKLLAKPEDQTEETLKLATILGWCAEMLVAANTIVDDMVDNSEMRLNRPCWYRLEQVGTSGACSDIALLISQTYLYLRKHFQEKPYYLNLVHDFQDGAEGTAFSQICVLQNFHKKPVEKYLNLENVHYVCKHKSGDLMMLLVSLGMHMAGVTDSKSRELIRPLVDEVGFITQSQNDIWDYMYSTEISGAKFNDIEESQLTWVSATAFEKATPEQRKILIRGYGSTQKRDIEAVAKIYEELNIKAIYAEFEKERLDLVWRSAKQIADQFPPQMFLQFLVPSFYKRLDI